MFPYIFIRGLAGTCGRVPDDPDSESERNRTKKSLLNDMFDYLSLGHALPV